MSITIVTLIITSNMAASERRQAMEDIKIVDCFMHFDGITEPLSKISRQRLKKFIECRPKWAKLECQQAEIANRLYEKFDDETVEAFLDESPKVIVLEW